MATKKKHTVARNSTKPSANSEQTAEEILTLVRKHEPEDQNTIIRAVLMQMASERLTTYETARSTSDRHGAALNRFIVENPIMEGYLKEVKEKHEKLREKAHN